MNLHQKILIFTGAILLIGCSSLKDITNPMKEVPIENATNTKAPAEMVKVSFYRATDALTIGQQVEVYIDDYEVGDLGHNETLTYQIKPGTREMITKVGWSIGLPVTGLGGACKFEKKYDLNKDQHFFKVKWSAGLFCGEHEVIEISEGEFNRLVK